MSVSPTTDPSTAADPTTPAAAPARSTDPTARRSDLGDLDLASRAVVGAGALARRVRDSGDGLDVEEKTSASDVVTRADHAAERYLTDLFRQHRPGDALLGEEGTLVEGDPAATDGDVRRWVMDPVDGTFNFVSGSDYWCSAVALTSGPEEILGAVHRPDTGDTWTGGSDQPTRRGGVVVDPLPRADLAAGALVTYLHPPFLTDPALAEPFLRVALGAASIRMFGSGSVDLAMVASGVYPVWCQHSCPEWDWLPGRALIEGAGGVCATVEVNGYTWYVAGRPGAAEQAVELLRG